MSMGNEEAVMHLAEVNRIFGDVMKDCTPTMLPDERFRAALSALIVMDDEDAADAFASVLGAINQKRNIHFLNYLLQRAEPFVKRWLFFLLDELNTTLEIYFSGNNLKRAFRILEIISGYSDARTLAILQSYIEGCRNSRIVRMLEEYRKKAEERISMCMKRIEYLDVDPIITHYEEWQS